MARYASLENLYSLGAPESAFDGVSTDAQETGLVAACDMVDSYLRERFTLPLVAYGADLTRAVCIIAAYDLLAGRGYNSQPGSDSAQAEVRYEKVIQWLRDISRGDVTPVVTDSAPPSTGDGTGSGGEVERYVLAPRIEHGEYIVGAPRPRGW